MASNGDGAGTSAIAKVELELEARRVTWEKASFIMAELSQLRRSVQELGPKSIELVVKAMDILEKARTPKPDDSVLAAIKEQESAAWVKDLVGQGANGCILHEKKITGHPRRGPLGLKVLSEEDGYDSRGARLVSRLETLHQIEHTELFALLCCQLGMLVSVGYAAHACE